MDILSKQPIQDAILRVRMYRYREELHYSRDRENILHLKSKVIKSIVFCPKQNLSVEHEDVGVMLYTHSEETGSNLRWGTGYPDWNVQLFSAPEKKFQDTTSFRI
jgi:hypothetical protein